MPVVLPMRTLELSAAASPAEFKKRALAVYAKHDKSIKICGDEILVATYVESERTSGGILLPNKSVQESLFQGTCGLVLSVGPTAFKYDRHGCKWESHVAKPGDWVVIRFADAWEIHIDGVSCRVVDHDNIRAIVDDPRVVTNQKLKD